MMSSLFPGLIPSTEFWTNFRGRRGRKKDVDLGDIGKKGLSTGTWILILVIVAGTVGGLIYYQQYLARQSGQEVEEFAISLKDGMTLSALDLSDFSYTLYGTEDLDDWLAFEVIETGTSLADVKAADLDLEDYPYFVLSYNGSVAASRYEDIDEDDLGDRTFYQRWVQLLPDVENTIYAYWQPSDAGLLVADIESGALSNMTAVSIHAGHDAQHNISITMFSNATQKDAAYVTGKDYETEVDDTPNVIVSFNETVLLSDFSISGTTKTRVNSTAIRYSFSMLSATPVTLAGKWGEDANDIGVSNMILYWVDTELAIVNTY